MAQLLVADATRPPYWDGRATRLATGAKISQALRELKAFTKWVLGVQRTAR